MAGIIFNRLLESRIDLKRDFLKLLYGSIMSVGMMKS